MSTSSTCIHNLADLSLVRIFAFLPPNECVRLETVCRKWRQVAKKYVWTQFRTLRLDMQELEQRGNKMAMYRALIDRCGPRLRKLSFPARGGYYFQVEHWAKIRYLRHLRFDSCVFPKTLRAVADNLTHLQSIHFSKIVSRKALKI